MDLTREFFLNLINHINMGIFVLDAEGNYCFLNKTYCEMFDRKPSFFENTSIAKLKHEGFLVKTVWEQVIEKKTPVIALVTIFDKMTQKVHKHYTSAIPTFTIDGQIDYIYYLVEPMENMNHRIQSGILNKQHFIYNNTHASDPQIDFIANSPQMKQLVKILRTVSKTDASILITGPTGSGKEVLSAYTHSISHRNSGKLVKVDCASIPENLLESELFGYVKGAFTGASNQGKQGLIELAHGGTLFLDELNSLPLSLQGKLLRVLETKKIRRLGANASIAIDFRLICASNENIEALVRKGLFRLDLYYRISVVPIYIPPLHERKEDITPLAFHFLQHFCKKYSRMKVFSEEMIAEMLSYDWQGNVRELKNFIESVVVTSPETDIEIEKMPHWLTHDLSHEEKQQTHYSEPIMPLQPDDASFSYKAYMHQCEKQLLQDMLAKYKTPIKVSEVLKLDISNVYRKMKKHQL